HIGGNEAFGRMGVTIIARPEVRERMMHPNNVNGQPLPSASREALPSRTYETNLTLQVDGEIVRIIAIPRAHTDGDTMVQFVNSDVLMVGDVYRSVQFPNIDRA